MAHSVNKEFSAHEIAELVHGELIGPADLTVRGVATLDNANETQLSFLSNDKYRQRLATSKACVVLVPVKLTLEAPPQGRAWIKCKEPSEAFAIVTSYYVLPPAVPQPGIHSTAVVGTSVKLGHTVHIGAHVVLGNNVEIGDNSVIEAGSYVGDETHIGNSCRLFPNVTIRERCKIGNKVIIHSGSVIGSDGFGYIPSGDGHRKIPQVGFVQIDDDVEIGANVTVDRARFDRTWIKKGVKIDNLVQIAHNVVVGEYTIIVSQVGVSGSVEIGKKAILAGQAGIPGHVTIGDGAIIMAKSGLLDDAPPGAVLMGIPTVPRKQFWKQTACLQKLPELVKQVKRLEKQLEDLKKNLSNLVGSEPLGSPPPNRTARTGQVSRSSISD